MSGAARHRFRVPLSGGRRDDRQHGDGLGYAIFNAQQYFQSARIVVGMLAIGITWLVMDRLILRPIEQRTTMRWGLVREGIETA